MTGATSFFLPVEKVGLLPSKTGVGTGSNQTSQQLFHFQDQGPDLTPFKVSMPPVPASRARCRTLRGAGDQPPKRRPVPVLESRTSPQRATFPPNQLMPQRKKSAARPRAYRTTGCSQFSPWARAGTITTTPIKAAFARDFDGRHASGAGNCNRHHHDVTGGAPRRRGGSRQAVRRPCMARGPFIRRGGEAGQGSPPVRRER
jgi:hypothetical protein